MERLLVIQGKVVSLSSDGTIVAVGADNDSNGNKSGHVRGTSGTGQHGFRGNDIDGEAAGDNSGNSVSLSSDGTIIAVGAYKNDGKGANTGHVRVYEWDGSTWTQKGTDIDGESAEDRSSNSLSLSPDGTTVAIGAWDNDGNGRNSGHVRVYKWNGTTWVQR